MRTPKTCLTIQDRISQRIIAGVSGGQAAVDPTQLLKDESEEIRVDAVRTLKFSHDPRALSALVEALRDASLKVKPKRCRQSSRSESRRRGL